MKEVICDKNVDYRLSYLIISDLLEKGIISKEEFDEIDKENKQTFLK